MSAKQMAPIWNLVRRAFWCGVLGLLIFGLACNSLAEDARRQQPPARLDRTNLLLYHTSIGDVAPVKTKGQWEKRRAEIVRGFTTIAGPLPDSEGVGPTIDNSASGTERKLADSCFPNSSRSPLTCL